MKPVIDVVIDIETLGTGVDAKIIGIGAVAVVDGVLPERILGGMKHSQLFTDDCLHVVINEGCEHNTRRSFTEDTLEFWHVQPKNLQTFYRYTNQSTTLTGGLNLLRAFVGEVEREYSGAVRPWGNGSVFDISILEHAYSQCGIEVPWGFRNIRDVRTRKEDALFIADVAGIETDIPFEGVKHYALDDAYHEAKILVKSRQIISDAAEALKDLKEFNK